MAQAKFLKTTWHLMLIQKLELSFQINQSLSSLNHNAHIHVEYFSFANHVYSIGIYSSIFKYFKTFYIPTKCSTFNIYRLELLYLMYFGNY